MKIAYKRLLLFPIELWSLEEVLKYLKTINYKHSKEQLRLGFSHLILIDYNNTNYLHLLSKKRIIIVDYDNSLFITGENGVIIENKKIDYFSIEEAINNDKTNFLFDIQQFGFIMELNDDLLLKFKSISDSNNEKIKTILKEFDIEPILKDENIPLTIKIILLETYALLTANITTQAALFNTTEQKYINLYSIILNHTFITNAIINKLISIVCLIDPHFSTYKSNDNLDLFIKHSKKSNNTFTNELTHYISNKELLNNKFSILNTSNLNDILGALTISDNSQFNSLINEISSHFNWANIFFAKIIKHLNNVTTDKL